MKREYYANVRVNFSTTYRLIPGEDIIQNYLLSLYETADISGGIYRQMNADADLYPQLINEESPGK